MPINQQSTVEDQGNWGLIMGLSFFEFKCKENFRESEEVLIVEDQ